MNIIQSVILIIILVVAVFLIVRGSNNTYQLQKIYELDTRVNVLEEIIWNKHLSRD